MLLAKIFTEDICLDINFKSILQRLSNHSSADLVEESVYKAG